MTNGACAEDQRTQARARYRYRPRPGFTLVELLAVIVLLGIVAAVAVPRLISLSSAAQITAFKGMMATARINANQVYLMAMILGPGGSQTTNGCTSTLDATGTGAICLNGTPVYALDFSLSCWTGMNQATDFKGPYWANQNSTVAYHTLGDTPGGPNYWTHIASGCTFTCRSGSGPASPMTLTVTNAACL